MKGNKRFCGHPSGHNFGHPLDRNQFFDFEGDPIFCKSVRVWLMLEKMYRAKMYTFTLVTNESKRPLINYMEGGLQNGSSGGRGMEPIQVSPLQKDGEGGHKGVILTWVLKVLAILKGGGQCLKLTFNLIGGGGGHKQ